MKNLFFFRNCIILTFLYLHLLKLNNNYSNFYRMEIIEIKYNLSLLFFFNKTKVKF